MQRALANGLSLLWVCHRCWGRVSLVTQDGASGGRGSSPFGRRPPHSRGPSTSSTPAAAPAAAPAVVPGAVAGAGGSPGTATVLTLDGVGGAQVTVVAVDAAPEPPVGAAAPAAPVPIPAPAVAASPGPGGSGRAAVGAPRYLTAARAAEVRRRWASWRAAVRNMCTALRAQRAVAAMVRRLRFLPDGRCVGQVQLVRPGKAFGDLELVFGSRSACWPGCSLSAAC